MVGRHAEFAQVRQVVDTLLDQKRGALVLVTGNAGIGKSRLTSELKEQLVNQSVNVLEGACFAYGQPPYGLFLRLLKAYFGIADDDAEETIREKIERVADKDLRPGQARAEILPYIEHLFSIRILEKEMAARIRHLAPPQVQQQTFLAVRELIAARARHAPLVIICEDVHWIDPVSLDLLVFIASVVEHNPVVIYCNSRPTEGAAAPRLEQLGKQTYAPQFLHVPLQPLSHADSVELVDLLLTIHELPERLRQLIPQRAEGNPFYLEEIIRVLIDRGIIRREENRWHIVPGADLENFQVPTTLQGLIMARVDTLGERARQAVQCAAVVGRDFGLRLLASTLEDARNLSDDMAELEERALVTRIGANGDIQYQFNHILIQETIYASLLVRRREFLHHKIARAIETLLKDRLDDHIEELAFHYYESKDLERALPCLVRAGNRAAERFANDQALKQFRRAVECLGQTNPTAAQKIDLYDGLGSVQTFTADYDGATTSYLIALEMNRALVRSVESQRQSAEIMREIGRVCERRGDYAEALRWLNSALGELEHVELQAPERVRIYNDIGWVQYRLGGFDQAYEWRMKSLQVVEGTDNYSEMASAYNGLAVLFSHKGDWERAAAYVEKGLRLRETIGDLTGVSNSHNNLGNIALGQGDWNRASEHFLKTIEIRRKTGDTRGIIVANNNLSFVFREQGDYERAREYCQTALTDAEKIKAGNLVCSALNNLAHLSILQGEFVPALVWLKRSIDIATEIGHKENRAEALWLTGEAYFGNAMLEEAYQSAADARALAFEIGSRINEGQALRVLGKVALVQGALDVAGDYFQSSLTVLIKLNNPIELARTHFQLALLTHARGDVEGARDALTNVRATFERLGAQAEVARVRAELDRLNQA